MLFTSCYENSDSLRDVSTGITLLITRVSASTVATELG